MVAQLPLWTPLWTKPRGYQLTQYYLSPLPVSVLTNNPDSGWHGGEKPSSEEHRRKTGERKRDTL